MLEPIPAGAYLGDYEGELLGLREFYERYPSGMVRSRTIRMRCMLVSCALLLQLLVKFGYVLFPIACLVYRGVTSSKPFNYVAFVMQLQACSLPQCAATVGPIFLQQLHTPAICPETCFFAAAGF